MKEKVKWIQTKHLQDNYEYWIGQLKEVRGETSSTVSLVTSTSVQAVLEEIVENEIESEQNTGQMP